MLDESRVWNESRYIVYTVIIYTIYNMRYGGFSRKNMNECLDNVCKHTL